MQASASGLELGMRFTSGDSGGCLQDGVVPENSWRVCETVPVGLPEEFMEAVGAVSSVGAAEEEEVAVSDVETDTSD